MTVVAVVWDAAEPTLVRRMLEAGQLPVLASLAREGTTGAVDAGARLGSGVVWSTFLTGRAPLDHEWCDVARWDPGRMALEVPPDHDALEPFWEEPIRRGVRATLLDVPFGRVRALPGLEAVSNWGAHYWLGDGLDVQGPAAAASLAGIGLAHPLRAERVDAFGPGDGKGLARLARRLLLGMQMRGRLALDLYRATRPDLFLVVYSEIHRALHFLWHTIEHAGLASPAADLLREADRQLGTFLEAAGPDAAVMVFSLHGMGPTRGIPNVLGPLLAQEGWMRPLAWRERSWGERRQQLLGALKNAAPEGLKRLYHRSVSLRVTRRLAQNPMGLPPCDWEATRAFHLPSEKHGWIRVNLAGRESRGIVSRDDYDAMCERIAARLSRLRRRDGAPLVRGVLRLASLTGRPPEHLPDLIVYWEPEAQDSPLLLGDPPLRLSALGQKFTGAHTDHGFYVWRGLSGEERLPERTLRAEELGALLGRAATQAEALSAR